MTKQKVAGIRKLTDGLYLVRVQRLDPRTGDLVDVRRRVRCATLGEAVLARDRLVANLASEEVQMARVRLEEYAHSWMRGKIPSLKASTRIKYATALDKHILPALGRIYVDALRPDDVRSWFAAGASKHAAATVNSHLRVLKTMLADATDELNLNRNPAARVSAIPSRRTIDDNDRNMLTAAELGAFFVILERDWPQWFPMVYTAFATATRFGEVSALRWTDIDDEKRTIVVGRSQWRTIVSSTKTGQAKTAVLTDELRDILRRWRHELVRKQHPHVGSGWMFPARTGKPHHSPASWRKAFCDCLTKMNIDRRFASHGLRRTANNLLRQLASAQVTRAITGHATEAMTDLYSHVDRKEKHAAVVSMLTLVRGTGEGSGAAVDAGAAAEGEGSAGQTGTSPGTLPSSQD